MHGLDCICAVVEEIRLILFGQTLYISTTSQLTLTSNHLKMLLYEAFMLLQELFG